MSDPLLFSAEVAGPDLYRIAIQSRTGEPHPPGQEVIGLSGGETAFTADPAGGRIRVLRGDRVLWDGAVTRLADYGRAAVDGLHLTWAADEAEHLYGLGERFDALDQYGKRVQMWIEDKPGMAGGASYFCTPVLFSSRGYAWFAADNPEADFNLNADGDGWHHYRRAGGEMVFYLAFAPSLAALVEKRVVVQGPLRAIPDWAWGPWISRNSFETQDEAEAVIRGMVERDLPVAAIVQEAWKGTSETGEFNRFSPHRWPRLDDYFALCRRHDIRTILWQVPILHPSSPFYAEGVEHGYFVKAEDGSVSHRREWLAGFANLDFTNPDATRWFKDQLRPVVRLGVYGFKADDGEDIKPHDVFHDGRRGWQMHNEYSTLYNRAMIEVFDEEGLDGMLWARSGSLGVERAPALWAGDQFATWEQMRTLIPAGLSSGLSGMPFWGHDIGGYLGDPGPELYMRWLQFGAFSPLMQYHGIEPREPWYFGDEAEQAYRRLSHLRMNLRPTLIELGRHAAQTGIPMMRPMALAFPDDPRFGREETQFMLGPDLLVAPVLEPGVTGRTVLFPSGNWQHLLDPISFDGPAEFEVPIAYDSAPVFVRTGSRLAVELEEDAVLGHWRTGAPVRFLEFPPERAVIRNPRLHLRASLLNASEVLTFDAHPDAAGPFVFRVSAAAEPGSELDLDPASEGLRHLVALPPPSRDATASAPQRLRVFLASAPDVPLWEVDVLWDVPVAMKVDPGWPRVVDAGEREIRTVLENRSREAIPVRLVLRTDAGKAKALPAERNLLLRAGATQEWRWAIDCAAAEDLSGVEVDLALYGHDRLLRQETVTFARPLRWAVAGPFITEPNAAHRTSAPPEWTGSPDVSFAARPVPVRWESVAAEDVIRHSGLDFIHRFGPQDHAMVYAMTYIESDRDQAVELRAGSDDTLILWLNGERIFDAEVYRNAEWDQEIIPVQLRAGVNRLVAKVAQAEFGWQLHLHGTAPGGHPTTGVRDGFADLQQYAPDRDPPERILAHPGALRWEVAGPFPFEDAEAFGGDGPLDELARASSAERIAADPRWNGVTVQPALGEPVDLSAVLGPAEFAFAYALARVEVDEPVAAELLCGSDDGIRLWLNGERVLDAERMRPFVAGSDRVPVTLRAGTNVIVARVSQAQGGWKFLVEAQDPSTRPPRPLGSVSERISGPAR